MFRTVMEALACVIVSAFCVGVAPAVAGEECVPKGLSASDWSSIRAAYEANRHAAFAVEGGYQVRNPGQQWRTSFDGRGFLTTPDTGGWTWGLRLVSYGREYAERTVAAPTGIEAAGTRVAYAWSEGLTEWYINDQRGLKHGYTVHQRPEVGAGLLRFTLAVRGDLCPQVRRNGRGVSFISTNGAAVVIYSGLKVLDADGAAVPAWFEAAGEGLALSVDDRAARYPLTIDPFAQQAYLKASNTAAFDGFGDSVAISGDTVVVGAPHEDSNATGVNGNQTDNSMFDAGAAYVFVRSGETWSQQAYLKASNSDVSDLFGSSVAISDDTVVVGAYTEASNATGVNGNQTDNSLLNAGAVYVFARAGTTWSQQAYLKASNTGIGDNFGYSVAVSGDTILVGALSEDSNAVGVNGNQADNSATNSGAVYVFIRSAGGTTWSQQAYLKASNTDSQDGFGYSVALSGDTAVVGAFREASSATGVNGNQGDNSAIYAGAAYVFFRRGTTWIQQAYLKASNTASSDTFGCSVAISGDTVVVGAYGEDSNATGVNGNQADNSATESGAAYVFARTGTVWSQQAYLKASNTGADDQFGRSVAVSGDAVVVGAWHESSSATGVNGNPCDDSASESGAAYVFMRTGTIWNSQAYLKASNAGAGDQFGWSVAISGDTVVVGAHDEDSNATGVNGNQGDNSASSAGAAYVFPLTGSCDGNQPGITQQPSGQSAVSGGAATFIVAATSPPGLEPLAYQWRKNGVNLVNGGAISGATSAILTISPVALSDNAAAFDCIVANTCGPTPSYPAGLAVDPAPSGACCHGATCVIMSSAVACSHFGTYLGDGSVCSPAARGGSVNVCCKPDYNDSGALQVQDIFDFLNAWFAGCP
jgi:hypothetical protein